MISYLHGTILRKSEKYIILDVGGVGYKVFLSTRKMSDFFAVRKKIKLFCYTNTKKNPWEVYGFFSADEADLFDFLIKISGIGPRAALEASSLGSLDKIRQAIEKNDRAIIDELFVLGQKKAQAIIFEFSRKIRDNSKKISSQDEEAIKALVKFGFRRTEVKEVVLRLSSLDIEEKIKEAIKLLSIENEKNQK